MNDFVTIHVNRKFLAVVAAVLALFYGGQGLYHYGLNKGVEMTVQYVLEGMGERQSHHSPMERDIQ